MFLLQTFKRLIIRITLLLVCSLGLSLGAFSQINSFVIQGTVVDSINKTTLSYVTVILKESGIDQNTKVTLSDENGSFQLEGLKRAQYQLILTYLGFETKTINIPYPSSPSIKLGNITLSPISKLLEEVHVITRKPIIEHELDKITYNVEADSESNFLNTFDMFRKVPAITIDAEDNLQLNGNSNYQILVNGKKTALFSDNSVNIFRSLPASAIKKIEIITNPSAKYEATGVGGIINIVTHSSSIRGYDGAINVSGNTPKGYTGGSYLRGTMEKISFSGRINHTYSSTPSAQSSFLRQDLVNFKRLEQTGNSESNSRLNSMGGQITYDLTKLDHFSFNYSLNKSNNETNYLQLTQQFDVSDKLVQAYQNLNNTNGSAKGSDIGLDYQHNFKDNDHKQLSVSFNMVDSKYKHTTNFVFSPLLNHTEQKNITNNDNTIREYIIQADHIQPIGKQTIEFGLKSMFQKNTSNYFYKFLEPKTNSFILETDLSNDFSYKQNLHAVYLSVNLKKKNWALILGSRIEATFLNADFKSDSTTISQYYLSLLPNLSVSHLLKANHTVRLSYSQRINRPGLYSLNPYIDLTDPLNISYGNPELSPAFSHQVQLEYNTSLKNIFANVSLSHNFSNSSIEQITIVGSDAISRSTYDNIGRNQNYNLSLTGNTTLANKLNINFTASTSYVMFTSFIENKSQTNEGITNSISASSSYRFTKDLRLNGNISYNSSNVLLQGKTSGYTWSSLSVSKDILKEGKGNISLSVRSPFTRSRHVVNEIQSPTFYQVGESETIIRQFSLSFNYRFSKLESE